MAIRLPLEILTAIVKEAEDVRDLYNLRATCRSFCTTATPIAFRTLSVIATRASAQNLGRLLDRQDIASYVREVSFHDTGTDRRGRTLNYVRKNAINELASVFSCIHQLPHLEILNLTFNPAYDDCGVDSDDKGRVSLQMSTLFALNTSFTFRVAPKLTSLSLHNLRIWRLFLLESYFRSFFTTLRRLQLSVLADVAPVPSCFPFQWYKFWAALPRKILVPAQHTLTELTLHSESYIDDSSEMSFGGLHFPHLFALSLCKFVFTLHIGVAPFILRHAATLAQLELLSCRLSTTGGVPYSLTNSALQSWAHTWVRFEAELTNLVVLRVDSPNYRYFSNPSELRKDAAALQRFQTTVAARSSEGMRSEA